MLESNENARVMTVARYTAASPTARGTRSLLTRGDIWMPARISKSPEWYPLWVLWITSFTYGVPIFREEGGDFLQSCPDSQNRFEMSTAPFNNRLWRCGSRSNEGVHRNRSDGEAYVV